MDEVAARRAGRREANLRALNLRIEAVQELEPSDPLRIVCECARADCEDGLDVEHRRFAEVRELDDTFFVVPGHALIDYERVVVEGHGWQLVQKLGRVASGASSARS